MEVMPKGSRERSHIELFCRLNSGCFSVLDGGFGLLEASVDVLGELGAHGLEAPACLLRLLADVLHDSCIKLLSLCSFLQPANMRASSKNHTPTGFSRSGLSLQAARSSAGFRLVGVTQSALSTSPRIMHKSGWHYPTVDNSASPVWHTYRETECTLVSSRCDYSLALL